MGVLQTELLTNKHWEGNTINHVELDVAVYNNTTTTRVADQQVLGGK